MYPRPNHLSILLLLACLGLASAGAAKPDQPYGARVTVHQVSPSVWSYTLHNTSTSQDGWLWMVRFESMAPIAVPSGWEADWSGKDGWYWVNSTPTGDPTSSSCVMAVGRGIEPGGSLGGFVFDYGSPSTFCDLQNAGLWWAEFRFPGPDYATYTGYLELAEDAVPELSSLCSLGSVVLAVGAVFSFRRRRRSEPNDASPAS